MPRQGQRESLAGSVAGGEPAGLGLAGAGESARDRALDYLRHQARCFPRLDLKVADLSGLEARDRGLAHAVIDGALRRWLTLGAVVGRFCKQGFEHLEPGVKAALLGGAAQIVLMERVPAYAAIDHAVGWAKRKVRPGAGGLVNAVLRRVAELVSPAGAEGERRVGAFSWGQDEVPVVGTSPDGATGVLGLRLAQAVWPGERLERAALATGLPVALVRTWAEQVGEERALATALLSVTPAPVVLCTAFAGELALPREALVPHARPGFAVYRGDHEVLAALLRDRRDVWAQDPGSFGAVKSIADRVPAPGLIVDVCAGRGTKTRQLAATFPRARIVAMDTDEGRRATLAAVFKGHPRVTVVKPEGMVLDLAGKADLVLLDVPCSNTGVLSRRPEARYRFNLRAVEELAGVQRQVIADAIPLLREGLDSSGRGAAILYATCSLDPRENQQMAAWARQWHGFATRHERLEWPALTEGGHVGDNLGDLAANAARWCDGAYSVLLERER
jgi:16S rRNA (cytosine967-C5)-methyltransferase